MPRVHFVKKARKDVPNSDIKAGESYYWWKFRFGGKRVSRTRPKASQLTQSSFLSTLYDIQDLLASPPQDDSLPDFRDDIVSQLEDLKGECEDSLSNMPDSLQYSPTGELLQERIDALESAISELEGIELDEFSASEGSEVEDEHRSDADDEPCATCGGTERHTLECEHNDEAENVNADDETEAEYWANKAEEVSGIDIAV